MKLARLAATLLAPCVLVAACGGDDPQVDVQTPVPERSTPHLTLAEAEQALEEDLAIVRTGGGTVPAAEAVSQPLLDSARYAPRSGSKFSMLVFSNTPAARRAVTELGEAGYFGYRALNAIVVFDEAPEPGSTQAIARRAFARLVQACAGEQDDRLTELCDPPEA